MHRFIWYTSYNLCFKIYWLERSKDSDYLQHVQVFTFWQLIQVFDSSNRMYKPLLWCGLFSRCLSVPLSVPQAELMLHTQTVQAGRSRSVTTASQRPTITNQKLSKQLHVSQHFFSLFKECYWYDLICQNVQEWVYRPCTCINFTISFAFNKMTHGTSKFLYPVLTSPLHQSKYSSHRNVLNPQVPQLSWD